MTLAPGWDSVTEAEQAIVIDALAPDESVRWCGTTDAARRREAVVTVVTLGVFMAVLGVGAIIAGITPTGRELTLIATWLVLVAIALAATILQLTPLRRELYVVTTDRAIIFSGLLRREPHTIPPHELVGAKPGEPEDGVGDILFDHMEQPVWLANLRRARLRQTGFMGVRDYDGATAALRVLIRRYGLGEEE